MKKIARNNAAFNKTQATLSYDNSIIVDNDKQMTVALAFIPSNMA